MTNTFDAAKAIYREAIDLQASDGKGSTWWEAVVNEVRSVVAARSVREAADVIPWWHQDWTVVSDRWPDAFWPFFKRVERGFTALMCQLSFNFRCISWNCKPFEPHG